MPKIVVCITEDWFAVSHFRPLLRALKSVSDSVTLLTGDNGNFEKLRDLNLELKAFDYRRGRFDPLTLIQVAQKLRTELLQLDPDIVHFISMQSILLGIAALRGQPSIRRVNHVTGLGYLGASSALFASLVRPISKAALNNNAKSHQTWLFAENLTDAEFALGDDPTKHPRLTVLPGAGIDMEQFAPRPEPENSVPVISFVGRLVERKGLLILDEAAKIIHDRGIAAEFRVYGPKDTTIGGISNEQIDSWDGQPGRLHWKGSTNDVAGVWADSNICVAPSIRGEGMPKSMLEAAACQRAIVASNTPGCRDFVTDRHNGLIVSPSDRAGLADAIQYLIENPIERKRMAKNARQRIIENCSSEAIEKRVVDGYRRMLSTK